MRDFHRSSATWLAWRTGRGSAARPPHRSRRRRLTLEPLECRALLSLTTWTVNSLGDTGTGSGTSGDLRYVITQADQTPGDNTIDFAVTGTITLNSALPDLSNTTGLMDIEGPGASNLTVARSSALGTPDFGIFTVDANVQAKLVGLTFAGGSRDPGEDGGGINNSGMLTIINSTIENNSVTQDSNGLGGFGGGIYNSGTLALNNSTIADNSAGYGGGGVLNFGTLTVTNSAIADNSAGNGGGGIWTFGTATSTLTVTNSTISGNSAGGYGGGIENAGGTATVTNSTISGNSAGGSGGGIEIDGMPTATLTITNSTIANNSAAEGGGIWNYGGTLTATNSTIVYNSYNSAGSGGGGIGDAFNGADVGTAMLENTIVALNTSGTGTPDDISGLVSSASAYNLIGIGGSGGLVDGTNGNLVGVADPGLDPNGLQNNGGPTQTIALVTGSPAIDAGSNALAVDPTTGLPLTTDQRGTGFPRIANGTVDIGAYEVQSYISAVAVGWGTQTAALQTASDGLRLLPAGRNTDLPWLGIDQVQLTLTQAAPLAAGDITVIGSSGTNYCPVTVTGSGTSYTITLAQPINAADRVTITIGNATLAPFTRRLDVLPGDVNDDGVVNVQDMVAIRNQMLGLLGAMPTIFGDINGDGKVDINDYTAVRTLIGTTLPPIT